MQDSGSFFNVCKEYFLNTPMLPLFIIAVAWFLKKWSVEKKYVCVISMVVGVLTVFNGLFYILINKIGEGDTYYRFFWICPVALLVSGAFSELLVEIKMRRKYVLLLIFMVLMFGFSSRPLTNWINIPNNIYQVDGEVIEVSDAIMGLTDGAYTTILDNNNLRNELRQYNAKIGYAESYALELSNILHLDNANYMGRYLMNYLRENNAEYIVLDKRKPFAYRLVETIDVARVSETDNYYIYKANHSRTEDDEEELIEIQKRIEVVSNLEYIQTTEEIMQEEFIYISDFGNGRSDGFYQRIVDEINARESKFVIINSQLANNANWYMDKSVILADLKVPCYYNTQPFQVIEREDVLICLIDNVMGVSDETRQKLIDLKNEQIPILLVLSKEISENDELYAEVVEKNSNVLGVLTARKDIYGKNILEDRVLQYVTPTDNDTLFTIVRLKGLETE